MTRTNVVAPAWPKTTQTTKLLDPEVDLKKEANQSRPAKFASFVALAALIWSWVLQAEASQSLQLFFNKPFFLACFNHAAPVVLLPMIVGYYKLYGNSADRYADFVGILQHHSVIPLPRLVYISGVLSMIYLISDFFWYAALGDVSVAAGVAISNSSPLFVYCLSVCFLNEHLNVNKILGVLTAFVGVILIVIFQDGSGFGAIEATTIIAGISMIISSAIYAGYQVALQLAIGEDVTDTSTLLTLAGLCGLFTFPPWILGTFLLAESPFSWLYESLAFPGTAEGVFLLISSGALTVVFCAFLPLAICWTSPLETSVGCMLTIPLSGIMDTCIHHTKFSWECIVGSVLVMAGFAILECSTKKKTAQQEPPTASAWA
ncbi:hypothetical protein F441_11602 [Phytophthora nicotianae CJ01A1]|uniref:EamA domain-containing protein n=4 Tax=Phytophthora nicotianae TaxID=4792 RepID=W2IRH7_PHYNI|nr:hypothetical protein L915_11361 [Phytophthora nicotianae]ETL36829.1 hypothetical protein L916_11264 [Phytophthora nicotianae]ETP13156.1 hypothetical protein F441_11602 [Phytophthora nicotianae CJ01A1]